MYTRHDSLISGYRITPDSLICRWNQLIYQYRSVEWSEVFKNGKYGVWFWFLDQETVTSIQVNGIKETVKQLEYSFTKLWDWFFCLESS